jgi:acyl-CoA thioesterase-2
MPNNPVADLVEVLNLEPRGELRFRGRSQWMPHGRVFGGQVLAQSLVAASRTVERERSVHSLHSYFLRPGDISKPVDFQVDVLRDGRSFSSRRVLAVQDGQPILSMIASFQSSDPGVTHQVDAPIGIPEPEQLPATRELLDSMEKLNHPAVEYWTKARPFDLRHVEEPIYLSPASDRVAAQAVWFKTLEPLPNSPELHRAALAYVSDYSILESILRRHGLSWLHRGLSTASLDHAMWFHRPARVDEWLLYVQESPTAQSGRGLATGRIFSRQGQLIASIAQEGMIRVPEIS